MDVNPLKKIWQAGGVAVGTMILYSTDIATIEIAAAAGLDFVMLDVEHRPHNPETIHDLTQVARLTGMAPLITTKDISYHAIDHALDSGASGVVLPHVETTDDVAQAIAAVRHPPKGKRGRCGTAGHNLYAARPIAEEVVDYDRQISLILKVESESAIRRLDELVSLGDVDGGDVDGVMIGPTDLSLDLGIPGQTHHERFRELVEHVRKVCRQRGIHYGALVSSPDGVPDAIKQGASWVIVGSEIEPLAATWKRASQAKHTA